MPTDLENWNKAPRSPAPLSVLARGFAFGFVTTLLMVITRGMGVPALLRTPAILLFGGWLFASGLKASPETQQGMMGHIGSSVCGLVCGFLAGLAAYGKLGPLIASSQIIPLLAGLFLVAASQKYA